MEYFQTPRVLVFCTGTDNTVCGFFSLNVLYTFLHLPECVDCRSPWQPDNTIGHIKTVHFRFVNLYSRFRLLICNMRFCQNFKNNGKSHFNAKIPLLSISVGTHASLLNKPSGWKWVIGGLQIWTKLQFSQSSWNAAVHPNECLFCCLDILRTKWFRDAMYVSTNYLTVSPTVHWCFSKTNRVLV